MTFSPIRQIANIDTLIDLEEEMDDLADELLLAARLMIAFVDPDGRDEDDLCETCDALAAAIDGCHDVSKISILLNLALAQCQAQGCLTGGPEDVPLHRHLARFMIEAAAIGARLFEIEVAYEAGKAELTGLPR